ncbi:MAG: DUF819 family protein [Haliangiales bacterium]
MMATPAMTALLVLFLLLTPAALHWLATRWQPLRQLGLVVPCYVVGILAGNQPWLTIDSAAVETTAGACIVTAIALMLLSLELASVRHLARDTLRALILAFVSVCVIALAAAWLFRDAVAASWQVSGMLVGVYTGGIPNLAAVSRAVSADPAQLVAVSTADVAIGGGYLLFLLLFGGRLFGWLLARRAPAAMHDTTTTATTAQPKTRARRALDVARALAVGALVIATAAGLAAMLPAASRDTATIILTTALASLLSLSARVRQIPATYATGDYLLMVFCVALGSLADVSTLAATDPALLLYTITVVFGSIGLHTALCALAKIDRDTCIITQVASIYGPPFVAPVATRLQNQALVLPGVTAGILGLAVGNYLGIAIAWLSRWLLL